MKKKTNAPCDLREVEGTKIRRQYFTWVIYTAVILEVLVVALLSLYWLSGEIPDSVWPGMLLNTTIPLLIFFSPGIVLAILNRSHFGEIICVLAEQGIYHQGGFVPWENIDEIFYEMDCPDKHSLRYEYQKKRHGNRIPDRELYTASHTFLKLKKGSRVVLLHTPRHLLREIKKQRPELTVRTNTGMILTVLVIVFIVLLSILIPIWMNL